MINCAGDSNIQITIRYHMLPYNRLFIVINYPWCMFAESLQTTRQPGVNEYQSDTLLWDNPVSTLVVFCDYA